MSDGQWSDNGNGMGEKERRKSGGEGRETEGVEIVQFYCFSLKERLTSKKGFIFRAQKCRSVELLASDSSGRRNSRDTF